VILFDVNVLVYAFRVDSPLHESAKSILEKALSEENSISFPSIGASFLRLVTNPKIFVHPSPPLEAWSFLDALTGRKRFQWKNLDEEVWKYFRQLSLSTEATGNIVPDALLAAAALRYDCTLSTFDRGFSRFGGLKVKFLN